MPSKGDQQVNSFVGGLITEASPLTFPDSASLDENNFKLKRDGSRERRLGMDYEDGYTLHTTGYTDAQMAIARQKVFVWPTPDGSNKVEIGVIQVGSALFFIDLFAASPSANLLNGGVALLLPTSLEVVYDFAIINNRLIVVSEELETPYLISYDDETDTISTQTARINIRDLYGVDDGLNDSVRPGSLSSLHKYNLRNQGWSGNIVSTCGTDAIDCTFTNLGVYPSNVDTWSLGKIADVSSADVDKYDPATLNKNSFDIGRAARGHYIIDFYNRGGSREQVSGISIPNADRELGRISTIASYAGRIFYSGIRSRVTGGDGFSPNLGNAVLFTQTVENIADLIKCYQDADPTSPEQSDIIDTDGGILYVTGAVNIIKLLPVKASLFVFAQNGVWEIKGEDGGFKATSFQVNKVSSIGTTSRDSIIEANGTIYFWASEGIFSLSPNELGESYDTTNLTISTVQSAYDSLPNLIKSSARGIYDVSDNSIRWLFQADDTNVIGDPIDIPEPDAPVFLPGTPEVIAPVVNNPKVVKASDDSYVVIYNLGTGSYHMQAVAITVNADLSLSVGTPVTLRSTDCRGVGDVAYLEDGVVLATYSELPTSNIYANVLTVTGNSISVGASNTLFAATGNSSIQVEAFSSTSAIISYKLTPTPCEVRMLTRVGDVITASAATTVATSTSIGDMAIIDSNKAILLYDDSLGRTAVIVSSGATPTVNTPLVIQTFVVDGLGNLSVSVMSSSLFSVAGRGSTGDVKMTALTITTGTTLARDSGSDYSSTALTSFNKVDHSSISTNISACVSNDNDSGARYPYIESNIISGGSISNDTSRQLLIDGTDVGVIHTAKLKEDHIIWVAVEGTTNTGNIVTQVVRVP